MSLLFLFLSLYVGIHLRASIITGVIEFVLIGVFLLVKKHKRLLLFSTLVFASGVGLSFIRFNPIRQVYDSVVVEVKNNYYLVWSNFEKMYVYEPNHSREIGDILSISADKEELDMYPLESEFDFKEYLNNKGVYHELVVNNIEVKFASPIKIHFARKNYLSSLDENSRGIVGSLLFGLSSESELKDLSQDLHLMRLISSSGVYLYFLLFGIKYLLSTFIKKEKVVDILSLVMLSPYLMFSFPKFVVVKFFLLKLLLWINKYPLKKRFMYLEIASFTGIIFLLTDYHLAYQDGFFLSYYIPILSLITSDSFKMKKVTSKLFLTLVIAISFIPFSAKYYSEISILSLPLQYLMTPMYVFLFIISIFSFIGIPLISIVSGTVGVMSKALSFISPIMLKIYVHPLSTLEIFLFEALLIITLYFFSIRLRPIRNLFIYLSIVISLVYLFPIQFIIADYVSFINVGQGDATLIKYKNTTVLIDTGGNKSKDIATEVLIPFFKKKQIYHIDLLITTHDDFDHSGAVNSLISNFTVRDYVKDYQSFPINKNGLVLKNYNVYPDLWSEENDKSLVVSFKVNSLNYLVMGDAPKKIENQIMKDHDYIPCDVLKVGHHGSNTSTSDAFIKYLAPKYGVISCGRKNSYGHPHDIVVSILKKYKVRIRRTDIEGTITF